MATLPKTCTTVCLMETVGVVGSFLGGVLSILSPCSALLLPAFFAYAFQSTRQLVLRTVVFWAGLSLVLVPVGLGVGWFGSLLASHRQTLITAAGWLLIAFGLLSFFGGGFRIPLLSGLSGRFRGAGWVSVLMLGMVYGFAGFCAGPMLGAVLTTAAVGGSALAGGAVMLAYTLGMVVPLFLLAWGWDRFRIGERAWLRGREFKVGPLRLNSLSILAGALFVGVGLLFLLTNGTASLSTPISVDNQLAIQNAVLAFVRAHELVMLLALLVVTLLLAVWLLIAGERKKTAPESQ